MKVKQVRVAGCRAMDDAAVAAEMKALAALAWNTLTPDEQAEWKRIEGRGGRATLGQRRRMRQLRARIAASRTPEVEERLCDLAERLAPAGVSSTEAYRREGRYRAKR